MKREKGFTLIELLSVVVVLGITFMIVLPKLVGLISDGEEKEIELIEERVLSAAKDYVNYIDGSFYTKLFKEGDTNYIYKTDLIKSGLLDKEEITRLDTFAGVKGELLEDDKIRYTLAYINVASTVYTNEELYTMIQDLYDKIGSGNAGGGSSGGTSSGGSIDTSVIDDLQDQINSNTTTINNINTSVQTNTTEIGSINTSLTNLTNKNSNDNIFLQMYPVGSVYINSTNTNPSTMFGGTWTLVDKRFKYLKGTYNSSSTSVMFTPTSNISDYNAAIIRTGNTIRIRFQFYPTIVLDDTTYELGAFNLTNLGVSNLVYDSVIYCVTDGGNGATIVLVDGTSGSVSVEDVITKTSAGTIPEGSNVICDFDFPITSAYMLDSAASEFHFQRTA